MMKFYKLLIHLVLTLVPVFVFGQLPSVKISHKPAWVAAPPLSNYNPPTREIKDGYFLRQVEEQIHVEKQASYVRIIREIVSEAVVQNASEISVTFDPSFQRLEFHNTTVWRKNHPLHRLDIKKFKIIADEKELSRFLYQGTYSAYIIFDDIRKGDRIEFSYTLTELNAKYKNDKEGLFRVAVQFVQDEVRYMGVEMGQYSHQANRPEKVFAQR